MILARWMLAVGWPGVGPQLTPGQMLLALAVSVAFTVLVMWWTPARGPQDGSEEDGLEDEVSAYGRWIH